jgi:tetraacyldisaccharide 4'-kinase
MSALTADRVAQEGWVSPVPVICCGNATMGGAGKTTVALNLAQRLVGRGVHILLRGYGGSLQRVHRVAPNDSTSLVGDEALLLARVAPTWTGADRAATAKAAIRSGARILLMDDGLQNPTLSKTASILVIDGPRGFGNGLVVPAGPLREGIAAAAERCRAAVLIGEDVTDLASTLPSSLPVLRADLVQDASLTSLRGRPVVAFAGIALPEKFFKPLREANVTLLATRSFPDHHFYSKAELDGLLSESRRLGASLVTTPKDAVRLPPTIRSQVQVIGVELKWRSERQVDLLLESAFATAL